MTTLHDVAKRAGVAPITVSRVINHSGYVSRETRERVERAIDELGYVPNTLARGLRSKRSNTLALVMTDITNPFFTVIARGVEDTASLSGYTVIFCNTDENETEEYKYARILAQKQVDGVILVPACSSSKTVEFFQAKEIPVVLIDRSVPDVETDAVRCDSVSGAQKLVKLLLDLGHTRIAALTGPRGVSTAEDRIRGYRRALAEAGLEDKGLVSYGSFTQDSGYDLALKVMGSTPLPTAIFCANNFITIGVMKAMRDMGVRVPEDVALVGFDDLPVNLVVDPFFTVAAQPAYLMGQRGTQMLLDRLTGKAPQKYQQEILPIEIITRQSSGPALHP